MEKITLTVPNQDSYLIREQFNTLCSNITFSGADVKSVAITSAMSGDGKSYISMHIAVSFANRGKRVLLIDADMRRSRMASDYEFSCSAQEMVGLAHMLSGGSSLGDVVYRTNIENLFILPEGRDVVNPVPLLTSQRFEKLIKKAEEVFDLIIIDTPPIGMVIDAAEIARHTSGLVFVTNYKRTRRRELREAKSMLDKAEVPVLGCVMNRMEHKGLTSKYYSHYYSHYYKNDYYRNGYQRS